MAVNEGAIDLTNKEVESTQRGSFENKPVKVFKPKEGRSYRIKFVSSQVEMRRRHYNPHTKKYFRCLDYQGYCPICVAASNKVGQGALQIKKASETFGANILVYDTNDEGLPTEPYNAEVHFWAFGSDKFVQLRGIINEWGPIENIDLLVACTDEQFQKVSFTAARKCYYAEEAALKASCDKKIQSDSYPLDKFLCKEKPLVELVKEFNLDINTYVPQEILAQMAGGPTAQDLASAPSQTQAPVAGNQTAQQFTQQSQPQPQQQAPQTTPEAASQYTPPQPSGANFADLNQLQSLL